MRSGAFGDLSYSGPGHVDFDKSDRAPFLLISGSNDNVVTQSTVEKEFAADVKHGPAVVEFKLIQSKTHGITNQGGWKDVADYALEFCQKHKKQ